VKKNLSIVILAIAGAAQAATVQNNSFEAPVFGPTGWTYYGGSAFSWTFGSAGIASQNSPWFVATPPDGNQAGFIQMGGFISQDILDFNPADLYTMTFYVARRVGYGLNPIGVTLTDDSNSSVMNLGTATPSSGSFFDVFTSLSFEPTNSGMTLTFTGLDASGDNDTALDLVSFTDLGQPSSVPEPATLALIGSALIAVGVARYRRRPR